jgi:ribulose-phosphate 3-epimerase
MAETARAGARYAHIDVMDGMFVPQISLGMPVIKSIRPASDLVFDVHMMVTKPERYIDAFADCGADIITFHLEATEDPDACIEMIRARGVKVGLSIKPGTPVEAAEPYLDKIDMLLIMTVEPGFGGQKFIPASYERIPQARKMITDRNLNVDIEVDGGIKLDNVDSVLDAGANIIVAGSAVYGKDTYGCTKAFLDDFADWQAKQ